MWLVFGLIAIGFTVTNIVFYFIGKDFKIPMVLGLAFTALTLCAEYQMIAKWAITEDFSAIMDVAPTMNIALWVLTIISIILNLLPLVLDKLKADKRSNLSF